VLEPSQRLSRRNTEAGVAALRAEALIRRRRAGEDLSPELLLEAIDAAVASGAASFAPARWEIVREVRGSEAAAHEARRDARSGDVEAAAWLSEATSDPLESMEMLRMAVVGGSAHASRLIDSLQRRASSVVPEALGDASRALEAWVERLDRADAEHATPRSFRSLWEGVRSAEAALEDMGSVAGVEAVQERRFALVREYVGAGSGRSGSFAWRQEVAAALSEWWEEVVPSARPTLHLFSSLAASHAGTTRAELVGTWVDGLAPTASDDDVRGSYGTIVGHGMLSRLARAAMDARRPADLDRLEIALKEHPELYVAHAAAIARATPAGWADGVRHALARDAGDLEEGDRRYVEALLSHVWLDVLTRREPRKPPFLAERGEDVAEAVRSAALGAGAERRGVDEAYVEWLLGEGAGASIGDPVAEAAALRGELGGVAGLLGPSPFDRADAVAPLVRALRERDDEGLDALIASWRADPDACSHVSAHLAPAEVFRLAERTSDTDILRTIYPEVLRRHPGDRLLARQAAYLLALETRTEVLRGVAAQAPALEDAVDVLCELGRNHLRWRMTDAADEVFAEAAGLDPAAARRWADAVMEEHDLDAPTGALARDLRTATSDLARLHRKLDIVAAADEPALGRRPSVLQVEELPDHGEETVPDVCVGRGAEDVGLPAADEGVFPQFEL